MDKEQPEDVQSETQGVDLSQLGTQADREFGRHLGIGETPEERARYFTNRSKQQ